MLERYGESLIEYEGHGQLTYNARSDKILVAVTFKCIQLHNGRIYMYAVPAETTDPKIIGLVIIGGMYELEKLEGVLKDGRVIHFPHEIWVLSTESGSTTATGIILTTFYAEIYQPDHATRSKKKARFYLTNLEFVGTESVMLTERYGVGMLPLDFGQRKAALLNVIGYNERTKHMNAHKLSTVTAMLDVELTENGLESLETFPSDICMLLSFAKGTLVRYVYFEQLDESGNAIFTTHQSLGTLGYAPMRLIDVFPAEQLKTFLEVSYPVYMQIRDTYQLGQVISTLCYSKYQRSFTELSALNVGALVDNIRAKWATKQHRDWILPRSKFSKIRDELAELIVTLAKSNPAELKEMVESGSKIAESGFKTALNGLITALGKAKLDLKEAQEHEIKEKIGELNRPTFKTVLNELIEKTGANISPTEVDNFIKTRNHLVHQGKFPNGNNVEEMASMFYFADRLIMALLGYNGPHLDCRTW